MSPEEERSSRERAEELKKEGNSLYLEGAFQAAIDKYLLALAAAPPNCLERATYYGNMAASQLKLQRYRDAIESCTSALEINGTYVKVLVRRSAALEEIDDLEHALTDAKKVLEIDPNLTWAQQSIARLEPRVKERQEKMKEEMLGKLKDLGNTILGKFGMSLDNFKAEKDPQTGSYSIQFKQ